MAMTPLLLALALFGLQILNVNIASGPPGGVASDTSKCIRREEDFRLYLVVTAVENGETLYFTEADSLNLWGRPIRRDEIMNWDEKIYGPINIEWYKVEYTEDNYRNGENPGWWADLKYVETPVPNWRNYWQIPVDVRPTIFKGAGDNLGTMRFKVVVEYSGKRYSSPGAETKDRRGISDSVHRISIRKDDTYVGWLWAFFNLPYIRGSASLRDQDPPEFHQAERFIGADCTDFVVAAWRRASGLDIPYSGSFAFQKGGEYRVKGSVKEIYENLKMEGDKVIKSDGREVPFGPGGVRVGDLILYWGHIGVLSLDTPPLGILDPFDLIIHTCFGEPAEISIKEGFDEKFSVVRWILPHSR
jgi:hypothetical protein